ncbi:helix-turn-helix domain-containing protein [uncultured Paracoccus sp.]|uniref:helix-turn-helix domain-containing protein n=1 Tax=uncultured Paracoccus sp. TaxID=189685 RepID=UPI0026075153|nr:helix-turn-helix domain-containing protein [uncultured Paracoccus sp.]
MKTFSITAKKQHRFHPAVAAKRRGKTFGRPRAISDEKLDQIVAALEAGATMAAALRTFDVARSTLTARLRAGSRIVSRCLVHERR